MTKEETFIAGFILGGYVGIIVTVVCLVLGS